MIVWQPFRVELIIVVVILIYVAFAILFLLIFSLWQLVAVIAIRIVVFDFQFLFLCLCLFVFPCIDEHALKYQNSLSLCSAHPTPPSIHNQNVVTHMTQSFDRCVTVGQAMPIRLRDISPSQLLPISMGDLTKLA